jgi:hypothetical protein
MLTVEQRDWLLNWVQHTPLTDLKKDEYRKALRDLEVADAPVLVFKRMRGGGWLLGARSHRKLPNGFLYAHDAISAAVAGLLPPRVPKGMTDNALRTAIRSEAAEWANRNGHVDFVPVLRAVHVESGCVRFTAPPSLPKIDVS